MRKLVFVAFALLAVSFSGCGWLIEGLINGAVDSAFGGDGIDPAILQRKGIEPGSKRANRLEFETDFARFMDEQ